MKEPDQAGRISADTASKLIMMTERHLIRLANAGWIPRPYTLVGTVQGYIKSLKDENSRGSRSAADSRVRDARADEINLRIERETGRLTDEAKAEALALVDVALGGLRADLSAVPARVTQDLDLRRKIETAIDGALQEAAHRARHPDSGDTADSVDPDAGEEDIA